MISNGEISEAFYNICCFLLQDLLFGGVRSGVVALLAELLDRFGTAIPNLEDLVPMPLALQVYNTRITFPIK